MSTHPESDLDKAVRNHFALCADGVLPPCLPPEPAPLRRQTPEQRYIERQKRWETMSIPELEKDIATMSRAGVSGDIINDGMATMAAMLAERERVYKPDVPAV